MSAPCPVCGEEGEDRCVSVRGYLLRHPHALRAKQTDTSSKRRKRWGFRRKPVAVPTWSDGIRDAAEAATALRELVTAGQSAQDVLDELLLMLRCSLETGQVCLRMHPPTSPADIPRSVPEGPSK